MINLQLTSFEEEAQSNFKRPDAAVIYRANAGTSSMSKRAQSVNKKRKTTDAEKLILLSRDMNKDVDMVSSFTK